MSSSQQEINRLRSRVGVVLATAIRIETDIVRARLAQDQPDGFPIRIDHGGLIYTVGRLGRFLVAHVEVGKGNLHAGPNTASALRDWDPQVVLMVGVAAGNPNESRITASGTSERIQVADVLVATQIYCYEVAEVGRKTSNRSPQHPTSTVLTAQLANADDWNFDDGGGRRSRIWAGTIASGDKKVNDAAFRDRIYGRFYDTIGLEMEGAGTVTACKAASRQFAFVKGCCDMGEHVDADAQPRAMRAALSLCEHVLSKPNAFTTSQLKLTPFKPTAATKSAAPRPAPLRRHALREKVAESDDEIRRVGIERTNTDAGQVQVGHWAERLADPADSLRLLLIPGPSGRGKTFFAKQLRLQIEAAQPESRHAWFDCTDSLFTHDHLRALLEPFIAPDRAAAFATAFAAKISEPNPGYPVFTGDDDRTRLLKSSLFAPDAPPFYLYLDDAHRFRADLEDEKSTLFAFLSLFLTGPTGLRLILTTRDTNLRPAIEEPLGAVAEKIVGTASTIPAGELPPFTPEETRDYLERRKDDFKALSATEKARLSEYTEGDPFLLDLIADHARKAPAEARDLYAKLLETGAAVAETGEIAPHEALREAVLTFLILRWTPEEKEAGRALAVLKDLNYVPAQPTGEERGSFHRRLLARMLPDFETKRDASRDALTLDETLRSLQTRGVLQPDSCDFVRDPVQEHLYTRTIATEKERQEWHARAMRSFAEEAAADCPELVDFVIWHEMNAGRPESAFDRLQRVSPLFKSGFRYEELRRLRDRLRLQLWPSQGARWAVNQGELGEVLYQGFNLTETVPGDDGAQIPPQNEWQLIGDAIEAFEDDLYDDDEAFVRFSMVRNILFFENSEQMDETLAAEAAKPDSWRWLIDRTHELQDRLGITPERPGGANPALAASLACFEGCYYNRGARLDAAIAAFEKALSILTVYDKMPLTPEQRQRLHQDRMDILNSQSRSRFLQNGPRSAIEGFETFVATTDPALRERQEYSYCLIDLCYYFMADGRWPELARHLDRAYRKRVVPPPGTPSWERPKRFKDGWVEFYFDCMEAALSWYAPAIRRTTLTPDAVADAFDRCATRFGGFGKDRGFFHANAALLRMSRAPLAEKPAHLDAVCEILTKNGAQNEPVARDLVGYLRAALACGGHPDAASDPAVANCQRRFPGLLGVDKPGIDSPDWKPPILMRGALIMRPNYCTPTPTELGDPDFYAKEPS